MYSKIPALKEMAEPRATAVLDTEEPSPAVPPANADDRKAAAALASLDAVHDEDESKQNRQDQEALGRAISRLEIESGEKSGKGQEIGKGEKGKEGVEERERKKIKVDQADVALLVGFFCKVFLGLEDVLLIR